MSTGSYLKCVPLENVGEAEVIRSGGAQTAGLGAADGEKRWRESPYETPDQVGHSCHIRPRRV